MGLIEFVVMADEAGIAGSEAAVSAAAIGLGVGGMWRDDGMRRTVDALMPEEMRDPEILGVTAFVEPDQLDASEFAGPLVDLFGSEVVICGEDFKLNTFGLVCLASHIVDETPEADEQ